MTTMWLHHLQTCSGEWREEYDTEDTCPRCGATLEGFLSGRKKEADDAPFVKGDKVRILTVPAPAPTAAILTPAVAKSPPASVAWDGIPSKPEPRRLTCRHGYPLAADCHVCDYDRRYYASEVNAAARTERDRFGRDGWPTVDEETALRAALDAMEEKP